jgi:ribosomal protein S16
VTEVLAKRNRKRGWAMKHYRIPKGAYPSDEVREFFKQFVNEDNVIIEGS